MATLSLKRGDTWTMSWSWKDDNGDPIDLTGASARQQIRNHSGYAVLSASSAEGGIVITEADGLLVTTFPASATKNVEPGRHKTDMEVTYVNTKIQSSETLHINVVEDISRD